ncbi:strongly-conserved Zn-finger binding protein (TFIIIA) [Aspergillus tubingensis]|uniref:C2H2-type zinc finger protein n=1 Tax=Aspergillus tubingensis TaxID=5068 RepID=UPI00157A1F82|nr:C2H2 transcription factor [Aspergillus tubingensis]GFN15537.1 C2H2 transcription factor [Aspergillus tubingensis]GLA60217.1 strongly-conserved Zn-finger binding protein (TFIIIA) [Aspergillus tubingensis]
MAQKRKASGDLPNAKRLQSRTTLDDVDPIYEEKHSDPEYDFSDDSSVASGSLHETPATPMSTISARYPSELKTHRCPFEGCTKAFNRPARLQEHLRSHNNERLFRCTHDDCDKTFLRASHLSHHIKSAHTGIRDYVCDRPGCGKSFVTGSRLRRHIAAHDGRDKYRCTEFPPCDETFRKHSTLQKHIMSVHLKQKPFSCPHIDPTTGQKCPMAFDTAGHLRAHESRIHTEKRFTCTECTQQAEQANPSSSETPAPTTSTFPTYALLQAHIRTVHPPQCPNCNLNCSTARELRRHLEVSHGNVSLEERKVFPCTIPGCDSSFTKKGNLTVHIRTVHQGEKRFVCGETDLSMSKRVVGWTGADGCGKRYGSKLALEEHIRTAHLGFPNAKAERRQRLGLNKTPDPHQTGPSALAALTGEGYAEETGRQITCFIEGCPHRFHRNYDLWVHMGSKHGCTEDEIRDMFMQRALLADSNEPVTGDMFGIYGLEFDNDDSSAPYEPYILHADAKPGLYTMGNGGDPTTNENNPGDFPSNFADAMIQDVDVDVLPSAAAASSSSSKIPSADDMAMIDPLLAYNMADS